MNAKLADFGFSVELPRISGGKTVFTSACIARSEGYYPSEVTCGEFSDRSDVYSFGVVCVCSDNSWLLSEGTLFLGRCSIVSTYSMTKCL